jgi:2-polyprenyl-3-methyl-5-hydroxy-6-metoxy-1,4-benzoquinol methylase
MQEIKLCPLCKGTDFTEHLNCTDHTVSHETFKLIKCTTCQFLITSPRPALQELGKYYLSDNYISHANESKGLFDKLYHISRHFTLNWKLKLVHTNIVDTFNASLSLLDFGCGTGMFLNRCKQKGYAVEGVEPSAIARAHASSLLDTTIHETIEQTTHTFDVITLWHVLEHIPDLNEQLHQLKDKLKENGTMFIAVPNHRSKDAEVYGNNWAAYDVPRHLWHFEKATMIRLLSNHSLTLKKIIPMKLDAFYVSMLSEKYKATSNGIPAFIKGVMRGFQSNYLGNKNEYSSLIYVIRK